MVFGWFSKSKKDDDKEWPEPLKVELFEHKTGKEPVAFVRRADESEQADESLFEASLLGSGQFGSIHLMKVLNGGEHLGVKLLVCDDLKAKKPRPLDVELAKTALEEVRLMEQINKLKCEYIVKLVDTFYMRSNGTRYICLGFERLEVTLLQVIVDFTKSTEAYFQDERKAMRTDNEIEKRAAIVLWKPWLGLVTEWLWHVAKAVNALHDGVKLDDKYVSFLHRDLKP